VKNTKQLASRIAAAVAMTALVGASAFADSRPADGTRGRGDGRGAIRRERGTDGASARRGNESRNAAPRPAQSSVEVRGERGNRSDGGRITRERDRVEAPQAAAESRSYESRSGRDRSSAGRGSSDRNRGTGTWDRNRGSNDGNRGNGTWDRNRGSNDRNRGNNGGDWRNGRSSRDSYNHGRYDNRQRYSHSGRVSRYNRYGGGYRVWIAGVPYPYYIPLAYWSPNRFRIGLSISLGGYYNSLGYYDYYDGYDDGYYDNRGVSSRGDLRGVVESVDYRRDTFVVRNEASGSFVTVLLRDRNDREVRPGDYVELSGDWTRSGVFQAYDLDVLDYDARRR
jgi:hypothetical protein